MSGPSPIVECGEHHDMRNYAKASLRMKHIVQTYGLPLGAPEAKRCPPQTVLVSPFNRMGRPVNLPYIHFDLAPKIGKDGFNPKRPVPGFVVKRTKPDTLARLIKHNEEMYAANSTLLPPRNFKGAETNRECLGGNHLSIVLLMYQTGYSSPLSQYTCKVPKDDEALALVVQEGHFYYELSDDIPDEDCEFLSEILNSDQNQNQANSEDHTRRLVQRACEKNSSHQRGRQCRSAPSASLWRRRAS